MSHMNPYHSNTDEPPSTSFLASTDGGGGYRYAAYEDDYLYDNNHRNTNSGMNMGGIPPGQDDDGPMNDYGYDNMNMNMNLGVDDNLSSSAASSHTPSSTSSSEYSIDFDNPAIANLPRILLMGPRRGGKTSIQRVVFQKMPPHETLFRLEATQNLQRAVVDHTPLCRFTIWDFPGDFYGQQNSHYHQQPSQFNQYGNHPQHQLHQPSGMLPSYNTMNQRGMMLDPNATMNSSGNNNDIGNPDMDPQQTLSQNQNSSSDAHIYTHATALIFVIDAQDEPYDHVLQSFTETVTRAISANPHVAIEVFINKVDGELFLSDEAKYECRRDIMQQVSEELADAGVNEEDVPISYHLTSIYDHSVFEAVSRVVQKLIPQLPTLEKLLDVLVSTCSMEKAYLFDVASKLYISTDSSPVDIQSVELCSDMIDVVLDVSGIYGLRQHHAKVSANNSKSTNQIESQQGQTGLLLNEGDTTIGTASESGTGSMIGNGMEVVTTQKKNLGEEISSQEDQHDDRISNTEQDDEKSKGASDSAYDSESSSVIRLSNGMILYLKEVDTMLALVCITRAENFRKKSLINYNISCLKKALRMLVQQAPPSSPTLDESQHH